MRLLETKEQVLAKLHELDAIIQAATNVRTELWSLVASFPESETSANIFIPLTFYEHGHVIAWGDDSEYFTASTFDFVRHLWFSSDHTLSKEDIRQDVIGDEYATDNAVWIRAQKARNELNNAHFPYGIETLRAKG